MIEPTRTRAPRGHRYSGEVNELDYGLLEALTLRPRAPWSQVSTALGVSAATAARRWEALRSQGLAWMSAFPGPRYAPGSRIVEIHIACTPHRRKDVAQALAEHPDMLSISAMVGDWDLVINTQTNAGIAGIEALLDDPIWSHPGIRGRSVAQAVRLFSQGNDWRIGALAPAQTAELLGARTARNEVVSDSAREHMTRLLHEDPRMSASSLAEALRTSVATVGRRLETLLHEGAISVRTEVAASVSGWSSGGYLYLDVPPRLLDAVGQYISHLPSTRLSMGVLHSRWNLSTVFWLNRIEQLLDIEETITSQFPEVRVVHRATRLREIKRLGWLLDDDERVKSRVPIRFSA